MEPDREEHKECKEHKEYEEPTLLPGTSLLRLRLAARLSGVPEEVLEDARTDRDFVLLFRNRIEESVGSGSNPRMSEMLDTLESEESLPSDSLRIAAEGLLILAVGATALEISGIVNSFGLLSGDPKEIVGRSSGRKLAALLEKYGMDVPPEILPKLQNTGISELVGEMIGVWDDEKTTDLINRWLQEPNLVRGETVGCAIFSHPKLGKFQFEPPGEFGLDEGLDEDLEEGFEMEWGQGDEWVGPHDFGGTCEEGNLCSGCKKCGDPDLLGECILPVLGEERTNPPSSKNKRGSVFSVDDLTYLWALNFGGHSGGMVQSIDKDSIRVSVYSKTEEGEVLESCAFSVRIRESGFPEYRDLSKGFPGEEVECPFPFDHEQMQWLVLWAARQAGTSSEK